MNDLTGLRVLVTRPPHQAQSWCETLARRGAEAVAVPMLELVPVQRPDQLQAIKNQILDFDRYQKVIFVSQNAVRHAMDWLDTYWPQLPMGISYYAVGEATARALAEHQIFCQAPGGAMNSEALLEDPSLTAAEVEEQRILIFRGTTGRPYMAEVLTERGARVEFCELYERLMPEAAFHHLMQAFADDRVWHQRHLVALHSGESLHNYKRLLETLDRDPKHRRLAQLLVDVPLLVPGERVTQQARELGFARVLTAENATDASMLATMTSFNRNPTP